MKAIIAGSGGNISTEFIYGAISCIIWTLTLQTTIKYVLITLNADNNSEGGIFSLFALIRKKASWVYVFALIGGATLLADGIITPSITVVSAVEGLWMIDKNISVVPIAIVVIAILFIIQQFGTKLIGKSFGPIMFFWFLMLAFFGVIQIAAAPSIIKSFNPMYAVKLLTQHPNGFLLLGAVFLCTTGAEALYSDLGHCGIKNIRLTWMYVKTTLILNYLGQGAWIISHAKEITTDANPFFALMPSWFLILGIIIAALAAIIASQALISGSYTIISEAILLNFWPRVKINYPTTVKGQLYVPSVNWALWMACTIVVLFFQESSKMEAAYGLSITITMLMTTMLLSIYLYYKKLPLLIIVPLILIYATIEGFFLAANLFKFMHGGWFTILLAGIIFSIMLIWFKGRTIKNRFIQFVQFKYYFDLIKDVYLDVSIPKYATNLVYITRASNSEEIEGKIVYSIVNKKPKRADIYWFVYVDIVDEPHVREYKVHTLIPHVCFRIDFKLGFKVQPRINLFFRQVVDELVSNKEVDITSRFDSLKKHGIAGDFKFVVIDRIQNFDFDFKPFDQFIMDLYEVLKRIGISDVKAYGLDISNVEVEKVPLMISKYEKSHLKRVLDEENQL